MHHMQPSPDYEDDYAQLDDLKNDYSLSEQSEHPDYMIIDMQEDDSVFWD